MSNARADLVGSTLTFLLLLGCQPKPSGEIRIGTIQPASGVCASFGQGGLFGVRAAVEDINRQGGVRVGQRRMPIRLVVVDSASDPNLGRVLAEKLILREEVQFLVSGIAPSPMHTGVAQVADRYRVPYVASVGPLESWMSLRSQTPAGGRYSWALGGFTIGGDRQGSVLEAWMHQLDQHRERSNRKVALLCTDDADGRVWYTLLAQALEGRGYTVVGLERRLGLLPPETTDFSPLIRAWKREEVDILWGNGPGAFFGSAWQQAQALGFRPKLVSVGRGAVGYGDIEAWGGELPQGLGTEVWWDPGIQGAVGIGGTTPQALAERWSVTTGHPVYPSMGTGYASVQVLVNAIERAGSTERDRVNQALAGTDMPSMQRRVRFDENHFSQEPLGFGQWFRTGKAQKWALSVSFSDRTPGVREAAAPFPMP